MTEIQIPVWLITVLISVGGILVSWSSYSHARFKDAKREAMDEAARNASINIRLDTMNESLLLVNESMRLHTAEFRQLGERVAVAENSISAAHHRIDDIAQRIGH